MDSIQNTRERRPYKRKMTEKRRIQNRVAQQVYRKLILIFSNPVLLLRGSVYNIPTIVNTILYILL